MLRNHRLRLITFAALLAALATGAVLLAPVLYDSGWLQFNHPDKERFPVRGLDVSHHQRVIDWPLVGRSEYRFVYIKATEGGDFTDPQFHRNWKASEEAGLIRGAYHFYTLCRPGRDQAEHLIRTVPGAHMLPPAIDLEFGGNCSKRPAREEFNRELNQFLDMIQAHYGTEPILYTTEEFFKAYGDPSWMKRLWIRDIFFEPDDFPGWIFWQYYSRASVPGINGPVDVNVFYGTEADLHGLILQEKIDNDR